MMWCVGMILFLYLNLDLWVLVNWFLYFNGFEIYEVILNKRLIRVLNECKWSNDSMVFLIVVFDIDDSSFEFFGRNFVVEENICFMVWLMFKFRKEEECYDLVYYCGVILNIIVFFCEVLFSRIE